MANREKVQIDGKDLNEFGIVVISYEDDLLASPKDGGGLDFEGIDGLVATGSKIMSHLTGKLEVAIEGNTELEVLDTLRQFKQFIRKKDFQQFTVDNNLGYFRYGKIISISSQKMTEIPSQSTAVGFFTFQIIFLDGYEYSVNATDLIYDASDIEGKISPLFTFTNSGASNRNMVVNIIPQEENLMGIIEINCYSVDKGARKRRGQLRIGKANAITARLGEQVRIDFNGPSIELVSTASGNKELKLSLYESGQFFEIPEEKVQVEIVQKYPDNQSSLSLNARVEVHFISRFN